MNRIIEHLKYLAVVFIFVLSATNTYSQDDTPDGANTMGPITVFPTGLEAFGEQIGIQIVATKSNLSVVNNTSPNAFQNPPDWFPGYGKNIVGITNKTGDGNKDKFLALFDNGKYSVYQMLYDSAKHKVLFVFLKSDTTSLTISSGALKKLKGDDLYLLQGGYMCVSRDNGTTWKFDTVGLGYNGGVADFDLDTNQNVYSISNTLYYQTTSGNTWTKVSAFPSNTYGLVSIFIDKKNQIFVGGNNVVYIGTNNGTTWTKSVTNIGSANSIGNDKFGNLYTTDGTKAWRSSDNGLNWTRIDAGIIAHTMDTSLYQFNNAVIHQIGGDSLIYASTIWGIFVSADQGNTWSVQNNGIKSTPNGYWRYSDGSQVATTDLGCFIKSPTDTVWTQTYPTGNRYLQMNKLFADSAGNLYTMLAYNKIYTPLKSTDKGHTWSADSNGFKSDEYLNGTFYVDETGIHHIGTRNNGNYGLQCKQANGSYTIDTTGIGTNFSLLTFASDHSGYIYASGSNYDGIPTTWRRPITGGTWSSDTFGMLNKNYKLDASKYDNNGSIVGINWVFNQVYHRVNNAWKILHYPTPVPTYYSPSAITGDATGGVIAAYYINNYATNNLRGKGIYCTHDDGANWTYVGLDSVYVYDMITFGDTTYILSYGGMYKMTCNGIVISPTGIAIYNNKEQNTNMNIYPNPASSLITLAVDDRMVGMKYNIIDITGRTMSSGKIKTSNEEINITHLPNGIYFISIITTHGEIENKKFIVSH